VRRAVVVDHADDAEVEIDRPHRALQRDTLADLPAVLVHDLAPDDRAVAVALEVGELLGLDRIVREDRADVLDLDREVRERHAAVLLEGAAEPHPRDSRGHAVDLPDLAHERVRHRVDDAGLVVDGEPRVVREVVQHRVHAGGHR
jgi:hypothetical protein